jgi:hypothetical protein
LKKKVKQEEIHLGLNAQSGEFFIVTAGKTSDPT